MNDTEGENEGKAIWRKKTQGRIQDLRFGGGGVNRILKKMWVKFVKNQGFM